MTDNKELEHLLNGVSAIDVRTELFRKGDFSFIVEGIATNGEYRGKLARHYKQEQALKILTSNDYEEFLYGGAAGGAKSFTGCSWLLFMGLCYPGTRWFIARNELKDILDSVMVTWGKVCKKYGFTDWKFNGQKNYITFGNGSHINLIEIKYKPSDPLFEDLGSTEYTGGWVEEVGEIHERGAHVISSRVGRFLNEEYEILGTVFYTCNPKKNWAKSEFYDKSINGTLEDDKAFVQCLVTENPFIEQNYIDKLKKMGAKDKSLYERLFKGNWDYEDNPNALCDYEMIEQIFDNDHVPEGKTYITADVARFGSDKAVIIVWSGWRAIDKVCFKISKTTDISNAINILRRKYAIPKNRVVIDSDGLGSGVVDETGGVPFTNNATPIKEMIGKHREQPLYRNLQVQCLYHLADKINEGAIWIAFDCSETEKKEIRDELDQIQSKLSDYGKLDCKPKSEIKQDIGRSPDWRDCFSPETKVLTPKGYEKISNIKKGDYVVTPYGNRKVTETIERDAPEQMYMVNGVKATGNHRFFTKKGLISADTLIMNDYIYTDNILNLIIWKLERLLSITDLNIGFQKRQKDTTTQTSMKKAKGVKSRFIGKYMKIILGRFLEATTYTILMETLLIIVQVIWKSLKAQNINHTTQEKTGRIKNIGNQVLRTLKRCKKKLKYGINLKKVENGIKNMLKTQDLENSNQQREYVKIAKKPISKKAHIQNFAQIVARKNTIIKQKNTTKIESVKTVEKFSLLEKMKKTRVAHVVALPNKDGKIKKVHTLTVDKDNCYFAEGMLVENCVMMRVYFDLKPTRRKGLISRPRTHI